MRNLHWTGHPGVPLIAAGGEQRISVKAMLGKQVIILGGGVVGLSTALHLQRRGIASVVVHRADIRLAASYGNGGLIQREAVFPYRFPRAVRPLLRMMRNRSIDVSYEPAALPGLAARLLRYWAASAETPYARTVEATAPLIASCLDEHRDLADEVGAAALLRPIGWHRAYTTAEGLEAAIAVAEHAKAAYDVNFRVVGPDALASEEPSFRARRAGAIHWTDSLSLSDPGALLGAYRARFEETGGEVIDADAMQVERHGAGWRLRHATGAVEGSEVVVAMGAASAALARRFGISVPLFGKRGYHMHYHLRDGERLNRPILDDESGFLLSPMAKGVRLTTGVEFARPGRAPTPIQLERAEKVAGRLIPIAGRAEPAPWMGTRPCMPDMLPVIGCSHRLPGLWMGFGHGHQGMTLGPTTGRLLAEMIAGVPPFLKVDAYSPDRFARR